MKLFIGIVLGFFIGIGLAVYLKIDSQSKKSPELKRAEAVAYWNDQLKVVEENDVLVMNNSSVWFVVSNDKTNITIRGMTSVCKMSTSILSELVQVQYKWNTANLNGKNTAAMKFFEQFTWTNGLAHEAVILAYAARCSTNASDTALK